jgi:hypothetical protein
MLSYQHKVVFSSHAGHRLNGSLFFRSVLATCIAISEGQRIFAVVDWSQHRRETDSVGDAQRARSVPYTEHGSYMSQ